MSYYRFSLPSQLSFADQLRRWVATLSSIEGYGEQFSSVLWLSVHEAFVNAVLHGNQSDPEQPVVMLFESGWKGGARFLEVQIRDFGKGFDLAPQLAATRLAAAWSRPCGRGLLLMSHYSANLTVERLPDGCVVLMRYIPY